jgi:hypothetical protein
VEQTKTVGRGSGKRERLVEGAQRAFHEQGVERWAERQFREAGRADARDLAVGLFAAYQGIALIANTLRDPSLIARETRRLERWIDSLT